MAEVPAWFHTLPNTVFGLPLKIKREEDHAMVLLRYYAKITSLIAPNMGLVRQDTLEYLRKPYL